MVKTDRDYRDALTAVRAYISEQVHCHEHEHITLWIVEIETGETTLYNGPCCEVPGLTHEMLGLDPCQANEMRNVALQVIDEALATE